MLEGPAVGVRSEVMAWLAIDNAHWRAQIGHSVRERIQRPAAARYH